MAGTGACTGDSPAVCNHGTHLSQRSGPLGERGDRLACGDVDDEGGRLVALVVQLLGHRVQGLLVEVREEQVGTWADTAGDGLTHTSRAGDYCHVPRHAHFLSHRQPPAATTT
jgi:hypothetical protein